MSVERDPLAVFCHSCKKWIKRTGVFWRRRHEDQGAPMKPGADVEGLVPDCPHCGRVLWEAEVQAEQDAARRERLGGARRARV